MGNADVSVGINKIGTAQQRVICLTVVEGGQTVRANLSREKVRELRSMLDSMDGLIGEMGE
jgi:hypothetical protein